MSKKMQIIHLSELYTVLSEKGAERLKAVTTKAEDNDEDGMPYEWYIENNLKPPKGLEPSEDAIDEDGFLTLNEGEFEYNTRSLILEVSDFRSATEAEEGSIVRMKDGEEYHVAEDAFEVYALVKLVQMNYLEKLIWKRRLKDS